MSEMLENAGTAVSQSESAIKLFSFENHPVRVVKESDKSVWFVGRDVAEALGYTNPNKAMNDHCKGITKRYPLETAGGKQELRVLSKGDVLRLICGSQLPSAQKFESWAFDEVLPEVMEKGGYIATTGMETPEELYARAMTSLKAALERQKAISTEQAAQLAEQAPAVEYCNDVLAASNLHTVNSIAVHLGISAIRLNRFLVEHGLIYKQGDIYCPSCKIRDKGYCDFHVVPYISSSGEKMTREHLKWTEAGRKFVIELWNRQHSIEKGA